MGTPHSFDQQQMEAGKWQVEKQDDKP